MHSRSQESRYRELLTRFEKVSPQIPSDAPEGWDLKRVESGQLRGAYASPLGPVKATFRLTDRRFPNIDWYLNHNPLAALFRVVERVRKSGRKVKVLDLGGGMNSRAARDLLMIPIFKSLIEVINVDPFAESIGPELLLSEGINPEDLNIVRGTIEEVQERFRGQIDLVYSYEVLPNTAGAIELMEACASLLAPDGEALLMDENHRQYGDAFLSFEFDSKPLQLYPKVSFHGDNFLQRIADRHDVKITVLPLEQRPLGQEIYIGGGIMSNLFHIFREVNGPVHIFFDIREQDSQIEAAKAGFLEVFGQVLEEECFV